MSGHFGRLGASEHHLSTAARKKIPSKEFGIPSERKYPMQNRQHQILAKSYAKKEVKKGKLSPSTAAHIVAMANRKLGE